MTEDHALRKAPAKQPEVIVPDADNEAAWRLFLMCQTSIDHTVVSQGLPGGGVISRPMRTGYRWLEVKMIARTERLYRGPKEWRDLFQAMKVVESEWMKIQSEEMAKK